MEFNLVDLQLSVATGSPRELLKALHGGGPAFGAACRSLVCGARGPDCRNCSRAAICSWTAVFGQELTVDPEGVRRHQKPPLPFVFSFREAREVGNSPGVTARLLVVGSAIPRLGMLLNGFSRMVAEGIDGVHGQLLGVAASDYQGTLQPLDEPYDLNLQNNMPVLSSQVLAVSGGYDGSSLGIRLLTPLKMVRDGRTLRSFDSALFLRSLLRRVSSLAYHYGEGGEEHLDFRDLSRLCGTVRCIEIESQFHRTWLGEARFSGITGAMRLSVIPVELAQFIVLGSRLHTGKGASWGFGEYVLFSNGILV